MPCGPGQLTKLRTLSQFVISKNTCFAFRRNKGLKELYELNQLSRTLVIRELRHGKDAKLESKDANMKEKKHLQDLMLRWIEENDVDESNFGYDEESLEALIPHGPLSNLQRLRLYRYDGVKFQMGFHCFQILYIFPYVAVTDANICFRLINFILSKVSLLNS